MRTVFVNPEKCVGCRHCEVACVLEHSRHDDILSFVLGGKDARPRLRVKTGADLLPLPNRCRHCDPAPCLQTCPSAAIYRESDTQAVLVDQNRCISCWMCVMVCPFAAMGFSGPETSFDPEKAQKCDACQKRLQDKRAPACVEACATGALMFEEAGEFLDSRQQAVALDISLAMAGAGAGHIPENVVLFKKINQRLARLGPLPSSEI